LEPVRWHVGAIELLHSESAGLAGLVAFYTLPTAFPVGEAGAGASCIDM